MLKKFWYFFLVLLIEGFSLMAAELLGAKLPAPFYGSSLYIWTAVLCITMLGLTLWYYSGELFSAKCHRKNNENKSFILLKTNLYLLTHGLKLGSVLYLADTGTQTRYNRIQCIRRPGSGEHNNQKPGMLKDRRRIFNVLFALILVLGFSLVTASGNKNSC